MLSLCHSQTLTIKISGIRDTNGTINLGFFSSSPEYQSENPKITKIVKKSNLKNGMITVSFKDIPKGKYGIALLDDENSNGKMDYSFFIPVEGFGFSDYYHPGLSKPEFNKFCFVFGHEDKTIQIRIRYI
jgi:uncharacterized protein (DUF2141 family)